MQIVAMNYFQCYVSNQSKELPPVAIFWIFIESLLESLPRTSFMQRASHPCVCSYANLVLTIKYSCSQPDCNHRLWRNVLA